MNLDELMDWLDEVLPEGSTHLILPYSSPEPINESQIWIDYPETQTGSQ